MPGTKVAVCGHLAYIGCVPIKVGGCGEPVAREGQAILWPRETEWVIYHPACKPEIPKRLQVIR